MSAFHPKQTLAAGRFRPVADFGDWVNGREMNSTRRALLVFASVGWIGPFGLAFWCEHDFLFNRIFQWLNTGERTVFSFHPVTYAPEIFALSMVWLAGIIIWWVLRLTRGQASR